MSNQEPTSLLEIKKENPSLTLLSDKALKKRHLWWDAFVCTFPIIEGLQKIEEVKKVEVAGNLRRKMETVEDVPIVVASPSPEKILSWFASQSFVEKILSKEKSKSSVVLKNGLQVDLLVVPENQFAFALWHSTGSVQHNTQIKEIAQKQGWSLNEKGLTPLTKKNPTEEDLYKTFGFSYIPPELRENLGELEAAKKNKIPELIQEKDIRGTFHNHTIASDGKNTLSEMVNAAQKLGWEYIGISDHSKASFQANGLSEERLSLQREEIKKLNDSKEFKPYIFSGIECDILPNGSLDFSNTILQTLDFVIASVHTSFQQDEKTMTARIIKAMENPYTTMLGHPTGRILLRREPYAVNMQKIIDACIANGKIIELNSNPMRLDMDWRLWRSAIEKGLKCCINIDAHGTEHLKFIITGVNVARKGWIQKENVINTLSINQIKKYFTR